MSKISHTGIIQVGQCSSMHFQNHELQAGHPHPTSAITTSAKKTMNPIQDFGNRYFPEETEILFTAADFGTVESVHPRIKTRYARQDGLAYADCATGTCTNEPCDINWADAEDEAAAKLRQFEAGHTYRLRVRRRKPATAEAFPHIEPERLPEIFRHSFMLVGILERDAAHPELDRIAAEYLRPVTYTDARGWTWTLDKKYGSGHFSATIQWQGEELNLSLHTDGNTLSEHDSALQDCHSFFADYEQHIDSLKEYIAQEMLSTAHELELQQDEPPAEPITATELKHRVSIFSLHFYGNGKFRATLSDDGIFWHHIIDVDGNLDGSYDEVELDG